ncbi:MAG TPA: phosphatase PAP2 family protein [Coriobacteriia bacterium]|nr:phosphatase PAP2 family protein [Coriobacteriia bacterium]
MRRYRPLIWGVAVAALLFGGFWELAEDFAYSTAVLRFDTEVSAAIQSLRSPALTVVMYVITFLGGTVVVSVAVGVIFGLLWRRGRRFDAVYAGVVVIVGAVLSTFMKGLFDRPRPPIENAIITLPESFSFPSGHTMGSLCLAWVLGLIVVTSTSLPRERKPWLLLPVVLYPVLVGTSRVYLGVHWPSDVLASWLLAGAWVALATGSAVALMHSEWKTR